MTEHTFDTIDTLKNETYDPQILGGETMSQTQSAPARVHEVMEMIRAITAEQGSISLSELYEQITEEDCILRAAVWCLESDDDIILANEAVEDGAVAQVVRTPANC